MSSISTPPRAVLVTGAAKRLGQALAVRLASEGWDIALHYRSSSAEAQQTLQACQQARPQGRYFTLQAELAQASDLDRMWRECLVRLPHVCAVVNNASVFEFDTAASASPQSLALHWQTNLAAPVWLTQQLYAHLQAQGPASTGSTSGVVSSAKGVVVNLLDQKLFNLNPDFFSYTLAKSALHTATTIMAQALAPTLRVVGVAPGLTLTSHMLSQEQFEKLHQLAPLGQSSTPDDIADAVLFALNQRAMTGTTLVVDGGQHLMPQARDFSVM